MYMQFAVHEIQSPENCPYIGRVFFNSFTPMHSLKKCFFIKYLFSAFANKEQFQTRKKNFGYIVQSIFLETTTSKTVYIQFLAIKNQKMFGTHKKEYSNSEKIP